MVQYNPLQYLPPSTELPDSDDTPVDNEFQDLISHLLRGVLAMLWSDRQDWFYGVDMGIYHTTGENPRIPIVPDGFLSVGVARHKPERGDKGRLSYVMWEENYVAPTMVLEVVSHAYGGEYDKKLEKYARLGALYYVLYNPEYWSRDKHDPFEVYRLVQGKYVRQPGEPVWIPEIGLAIGRGRGTYTAWTREWLYWYSQEGNRYPTFEEITEQQQRQLAQEQQRVEEQRLRAERLAAKLREMGIDPTDL